MIDVTDASAIAAIFEDTCDIEGHAAATEMAIKEILIQTSRSVLGVFFGLMLISLIAEGIESLLVCSCSRLDHNRSGRVFRNP
jgi:hypothetical protein